MTAAERAGAAFGALAGGLLMAKACCACAVAGATWSVFADDLAVAAWLALGLAWFPPRLLAASVSCVLALAVLDVWLVRALGVPMLPSLWGGCSLAMADSVVPYLTLGNAALAGLCAAGAFLGRRWFGAVGRCRKRLVVIALSATCLCTATAVPAFAHQNGLVAFVRRALPRAAELPSVPSSAPRPRGPSPWHGVARERSVVLVVLESAAERFVFPPNGEPSAMPFLATTLRTGLRCTTTWATYPESIEGQVALLCGVPPRPDAMPHDYADAGPLALPRRLRAHGYRSALFHAGRFAFLGMNDVLAPMAFDVQADAESIGGAHESSFGIDEASCVDALLAWVAHEPNDQRVLACWLPIAGHHPYASPAGGPFANDTAAGCSRNALHHCDQALQRLWQGLCALRPAEHWLLCVVGDHGQAFGEHPGNFGHSFALFEENLRVPFGCLVPGTALHGEHTPPCSHLDVVPLLLDLLGLPGGRALPGVGETVCAFTDWGELLVAARDARWKLIEDLGHARVQLFDLDADPGECFDLAARQPDVVACLRAAAHGFLAQARRGGVAR